MFPSWRPRISLAVGLYFLRFSSSASARFLRRAWASPCSLAARALLCRLVPLMILRRKRVFGLNLLAGLYHISKSAEKDLVVDGSVRTDREDDDVYASIPIVEYFREQSFASFARRSAT